jgi:hypothetical protein
LLVQILIILPAAFLCRTSETRRRRSSIPNACGGRNRFQLLFDRAENLRVLRNIARDDPRKKLAIHFADTAAGACLD